MNAQERIEYFLLASGESKISFQQDAKVPNATIFTIKKEDHTIGNLLKTQLLKDPAVVFAGYKMPHPFEHEVVLRIQTKSSERKPVDCLLTAIHDLTQEITSLQEQFREGITEKMDLQP